MTGAQLVQMLADRAELIGATLYDFARPLCDDGPGRWLRALQRTETPTANTILRIQALLAGEPVPPRRTYNQPSPHGIAPVDRIDPRTVPQPVSRDPCFKCGTRGDIGCNHQRREY